VDIRAVVRADRHDKSDGPDFAGCQSLCGGIWPITGCFGGFHDAAARFRAHFRISVECPADRRLRNAEQLRQLFQVHVAFPSMQLLWQQRRNAPPQKFQSA